MSANTNSDPDGYAVGGRTDGPHHPDGWFPERPADSDNANDMPHRGQPPASGTHDRPRRD